jgi:hypothetical protein
MLLTLSSTTMFSLSYVLTEHILSAPRAPSPQQLQARTGRYAAFLVSCYLIVWTIPHFSSLVAKQVEARGGHWGTIIVVYSLLLLASLAHSVTFFRLVGMVGAVSTGIIQALRAVSVFVLSAVLYCRTSSNQCFDAFKAVSTILVVGGVMYFSHLPSPGISQKVHMSATSSEDLSSNSL